MKHLKGFRVPFIFRKALIFRASPILLVQINGGKKPHKKICAMPKKRYNAEDIVRKLCETDVLLSQGMNISQICKRIGIADQTYYRWHKVYGGMKVNQAEAV